MDRKYRDVCRKKPCFGLSYRLSREAFPKRWHLTRDLSEKVPAMSIPGKVEGQMQRGNSKGKAPDVKMTSVCPELSKKFHGIGSQ